MSKHGTRFRYTVGGCRCDRCRSANAAYQREWRKRRKFAPGTSQQTQPPVAPNVVVQLVSVIDYTPGEAREGLVALLLEDRGLLDLVARVSRLAVPERFAAEEEAAAE